LIRAVLVFGWLALLLLAAAGVTGFAARDDGTAQQHLVVALFATAALLLADLCVATYLLATRRLVRRAVRELGHPPELAIAHGRLAARGTAWAVVAAVPLLVAFGSGFPTFGQTWPLWIHQAAVAATAVLQPLFLALGGGALRAAEDRLSAFAKDVERVRYTPSPPDSTPPVSTPSESP
jgi:hypothetical protein